MGMAKAKAAGSFIGALFNNPTFLILGALGIGLLFFQKDIRNAFAGLGQGLGNITLPEINLPTINLPTINFPEIKFPEIKFPTIFGGNGLEQPQKMVEDTGLLTQEETLACKCGSIIVQDAFGNVNNVCKQCATVGPNPALALEPSDAELFASQAPAPIIPVETTPLQSILPSGFEAFQVGDSGFVGAAINPTPIQNLSLSQIIDKFMVTASQAANIKAIAEDDFGDFDFGTNIGGIIPAQFGGSDVNVSSSQFEGLSASEIANILTGGNIQNF